MCIENFVIAVLISIFQAVAVKIITFKQIESNNKKEILFYVYSFLYCIISYFFIPNQLRFLTHIITIALVLYFLIGIKDKKVIIYAFNTEVVLAISEIIGSLLLVVIGIDSKLIVENIWYNLLINILVAIIAIVLICIPFVINNIKKFTGLLCKNKKVLNIFFLILFMIYLIVSKNGLEFILKSNYYINILFIIGVVVILLFFIVNELKSEQLQEQNKQMLNYVSKYEKIITEQGKANHEFKNQLMVIKGYAQMDQDKLLEYIDSIIKDANKTKSNYMISQLNKFPDGGIKGLLYYKFSIIEEEKINYNFDVGTGVKSKLSSLSINKYKNITKILGVLLDNAIDASKKSNDKNILVSVTSENNKVIFSIYNTFKGKIDVSKLGSGYTTKGKKHGYGLKLVNDIISTNNDLKIESYLENKYFVTNLIVNVKNKKKK